MFTLNPARLMGISGRFGAVKPGKEATLMVFAWDEKTQAVDVRCTLVRGEVVYKKR